MMLVSAEGHRGYKFGNFVLDLDRGALLKDGEEVALRPKSFEVLRYLVEHQGTLVTREELLAHAWPDVIVTDDSVTQCLTQIRRALGDDEKTLVQTIPRRGFIFEMPVHYTLEAPAPGVKARTDHQASNLGWLMGATTVLIGAAIGWWALSGSPATTSEPSGIGRNPAFDPPPNTIAVLAFEDLSASGDQSWFAEGISEEILNALAQNSELEVIARTSSFGFRGSSAGVRAIAERLNVANVLEGSVRSDGDRVRVTAQLVDGSSETHLWSHTFDRALDDVFGVQDDIAQAVAAVLEVQLLDPPTPALTPPDPEAWAAYLRAHHLYNRRGTGDLARAEQHYLESVRLDPGFARAWAGLAAVYFNQLWADEIEPAAGMRLQREAVENALRLAPEDPVVLNRAGRYYNMAGEAERARELFRRAKELDPDDPLILATEAARAMEAGDFETAVRLQSRAAKLDPLGNLNQLNLAGYLGAAGRYREAEATYRKALDLLPSRADQYHWLVAVSQALGGQPRAALQTAELVPDDARRWQVEALAHARLSKPAAADAALAKLEADGSVRAAFLAAEVHADRGDVDAALRWLQRMQDRIEPELPRRDGWTYVERTRFSPLLGALAEDERFQRWREQALAKADTDFSVFVNSPRADG